MMNCVSYLIKNIKNWVFISLINQELLYTFKLLLLLKKKVFAKMVKIKILLNYIKKEKMSFSCWANIWL